MLWKEKYELGVPVVDTQHQELFRRVETFMQTVRSSDPWDVKVQHVNETLEFMKDYVVEHFEDEETYQQQIGYPGYEAHKQIHSNMVNYVLEVSDQYEKSGFDEQLIQQFAGKLLAWLINHVAAEDLRIATFAMEKAALEKGVDRHDDESI